MLSFSPVKPRFIEPLVCPQCRGAVDLIRISPDAYKRFVYIHTFECARCQQTEARRIDERAEVLSVKVSG
jgi:Zn ribbon nucleic-acid-binding protein